MIRYTHIRQAQPGLTADWPSWLSPKVISKLADAGISLPYRHQVELANLAHDGHHCAITTPTASGKTLAYLMPLWAPGVRQGNDLRTKLGVAESNALYLAPTKALAHDQFQAARRLGPQNWQTASLDGDSSEAERRFAREQAEFILTNPDMLHHSILPNHRRYSRFLSSLRYVIIDEAHRYRGVFGSHIANILRRLRRICASYGADPVFILASATAADTQSWGAKLIGEATPIAVVNKNFAPLSQRRTLLCSPDDSTFHDAAELMATMVDEGYQVLCFVPSRVQAELVALRAQSKLHSGRKIASYRSGYLAKDRRLIEQQLSTGQLSGVAATNALELGIDITGLDAVIIAGFPGTLTAFRQQAGRAGRSQQAGLVALIAKEDPLDSYLIEHPELIFEADVEATVLNPYNPHISGPHIAAAAAELVLTSDDKRWFGDELESLADQGVKAGLLKRRSTGWYWIHPSRPTDFIDLRGLSAKPLDVIDKNDGHIIGVVDRSAADRSVHQGAVYLHQGQQWIVEDYLPDQGCALARQATPRYYTQPKSSRDLTIIESYAHRRFGSSEAQLWHGQVRISEQVTSYLRKDEQTGDIWDETPLDLPVHSYLTHAVWWTIPQSVATNFKPNQLAGGAHGLEHCAIGLLPLFASCDRWDIGGLSTLSHPDTGVCTIFVYDGSPGGAGFAQRGYRVADDWLGAAATRLEDCSCQEGCPSCIVSPKCGNANQILDKASALHLAKLLL